MLTKHRVNLKKQSEIYSYCTRNNLKRI